MKLIDYLVEHTLAPDLRVARGLILRGDALVDETPMLSPSHVVKPGCMVRIRGDVSTDVSRGVAKLRPVLVECGFACEGCVCLDLGVSTGGFTQVLLEEGATKVYGVDVAYGVTADLVRNDPRVVLLERTNARHLTPGMIGEPIARVTGDLSFISWRAVVPALLPLLAPDAELLLLLKPQFELASRGLDKQIDDGIVRDPVAVVDSLVGLFDTWVDNSLAVQSILPAAIKGTKGNQEYFIYLKRNTKMGSKTEYMKLISDAIEGAFQ